MKLKPCPTCRKPVFMVDRPDGNGMRTALAGCFESPAGHPVVTRCYPEGDEISGEMALMVVARAWNALKR